MLGMHPLISRVGSLTLLHVSVGVIENYDPTVVTQAEQLIIRVSGLR